MTKQINDAAGGDRVEQAIRTQLDAQLAEPPVPRPFPRERMESEPGQLTHRASQWSRSPRRGVLAVGMAVLLAAGGVWWANTDRNTADVVTEIAPDPTPRPSGFEGWEPGWHTLDPGPVPAMNGARLKWVDDRLIVIGSGLDADGSWAPAAFAYDPALDQWEQLPTPPLADIRVVAADGVLVIVGFNEQYPEPNVEMWATLEPGDPEWTEMGEVSVSPQLAAAGALGGRDQLLWTGQAVVDLSLGAVLDPRSGVSSALPMPEDVYDYVHLQGATPVWTGTHVVLTTISSNPGLSWDAEGKRLPDVPPALSSSENVVGESTAVSVGGDVLVVQEDDAYQLRARRFDPRAGEWAVVSDPGITTEGNCFYRLSLVGSYPVLKGCSAGGAFAEQLVGDEWAEVAASPLPDDCCMRSWIGTPNALVAWSADVDTTNNPRAPYREAAVWIP